MFVSTKKTWKDFWALFGPKKKTQLFQICFECLPITFESRIEGVSFIRKEHRIFLKQIVESVLLLRVQPSPIQNSILIIASLWWRTSQIYIMLLFIVSKKKNIFIPSEIFIRQANESWPSFILFGFSARFHILLFIYRSIRSNSLLKRNQFEIWILSVYC